MIKETKYQKLLVLINVILLLAVTGTLFTLYYPLEVEQGLVLLAGTTLLPLLYFWSLLFPIGRKHVKQLNIIFFIILVLWYCIGGIFFTNYTCFIFYYLLAIYMVVKKYLLNHKQDVTKVTKIFMSIVTLLAIFFCLKVLLDYYKIIEASVPIILFTVFHSLLLVGISLHMTMDENHFLEYPEPSSKKIKPKQKKNKKKKK